MLGCGPPWFCVGLMQVTTVVIRLLVRQSMMLKRTNFSLLLSIFYNLSIAPYKEIHNDSGDIDISFVVVDSIVIYCIVFFCQLCFSELPLK